MREILFKGKIKNKEGWKEKGEWIEGSLLYTDSENIKVCKIVQSYLSNEKGESRALAYDVDPETVCQYTGINDSTKWEELTENEKDEFLSKWNPKKNRQNIKQDWNGRMIFENDIIECKCNDRHFQSQIEWDSMCGGFIFQDTKEGSAVGLDTLSSGGIYKDFKLIGSIFDDPERAEGRHHT